SPECSQAPPILRPQFARVGAVLPARPSASLQALRRSWSGREQHIGRVEMLHLLDSRFVAPRTGRSHPVGRCLPDGREEVTPIGLWRVSGLLLLIPSEGPEGWRSNGMPRCT